MTLTGLTVGEYSFTGRYTDDFGNVRTSQPLIIAVANLVLSNSRVNLAGEFSFTVGGIVTGASLTLLGSSNLVVWEPLKTDIPTTPLIEMNTGPMGNQGQRFFRVLGEK